MSIDPRFNRESGSEVFSGNELLVKGCLESEGGVHLYTGYPGSPVAGFFDILGDLGSLLTSKGVRAFQANNEALSVAAVNGSQMAPCRAITAFKSVGVHVASDAMAIGNLAGAHPEGGAIVVCGDDPWCDSTQVPADSRFLLEHLRMAVVEPGDIQELKDWIDLSFKLSRAAGLYVGYVVTTAQADGGGTVTCKPNHFPVINTNQKIALETAKIDLDKVLLPPRTWQQELKMPERHRITMRAARELGINRIIPATRSMQRISPIGFITTGMARPYLENVLKDLGLSGVFPILNMGMSYPADVEMVREFGKSCFRMIVIEERRSFLEKNIRDNLFKEFERQTANELSGRLYGKTFPARRSEGKSDASDSTGSTASSHLSAAFPGIPETRGLNPSVLMELLIPLIRSTHELPADMRNGRLTSEWELMKSTGRRKLEVIGTVRRETITPVSPQQIENPSRESMHDAFDDLVISRTPTFCPGCPHRDSSAVLLEVRRNFADAGYMRRVHKREPVDLVSHGDTGCYTMLMFPPTEQLMHNYSGMGLGGGTGSGIDPFISNKQLVFMGDGTFFHSGQIAISNAIKANQDITFIILENKTTAMTGHQEHAGTELDTMGNRSFIQDIEAICRGMAGTSPLKVRKVDPADRAKWKDALEENILGEGVKVLIADKECGITLHRKLNKEERKTEKKHGFLPLKKHMNVTPEVCENCLECTKATACPGLIPLETDYGPKIDTDLTLCVNDGACERVRTSNDYGTSVQPCPSFEEVTITRKKRRKYTLPNLRLRELPEPISLKHVGPEHPFRIHLAGVGGMGIGVVGAILVRAGHKHGYRVAFNDKKGLAIRNGGVYSQIGFFDQSIAPIVESDQDVSSDNTSADSSIASSALPLGSIPYGKCDLLLGVDILEAARAIDPREHFRVASKNRTTAVLNLFKQPTVSVLVGSNDFDPEKLHQTVADHCDRENVYARDLSTLCEERLGSKQFVNIMILGVAFQLGLIPVSANSLAWSIKNTLRRDQRANLKAFNIGRRLALEPFALRERPEPKTWEQLLTQKVRIIRKSTLLGRLWRGRRGRRLEFVVKNAIRVMPGLSEESKYDLALRIYDLMQYQDHRYAQRFVNLIRDIYRRDSADQKYQATHAALWSLAKLMLIKDEPYVAYLLTRFEKKQRDNIKYNIDPDNGDSIRYTRKNCPEIPVPFFGKVRLHITTYEWQMQIVRRMKFLRKIPGWHRRETQLRSWYEVVLQQVDLSTESSYRASVDILKSPEQITGYREVRYPKIDQVQQQVAQKLGSRVNLEVDVDARAGRLSERVGSER